MDDADAQEDDQEDEELHEDEDEEDDDELDNDDEGPMASSSSSKPAPANLETTQILSSIRQSRSEDIAKGLGVKRQLELFEKVMPLRIRLQKAVAGVEDISVSSPVPSPELPTHP